MFIPLKQNFNICEATTGNFVGEVDECTIMVGNFKSSLSK